MSENKIENKRAVKKVCPCCEKHTVRDEKHKKALLNRLKRIEGQVRGIEAMIENDAYCKPYKRLRCKRYKRRQGRGHRRACHNSAKADEIASDGHNIKIYSKRKRVLLWSSTMSPA